MESRVKKTDNRYMDKNDVLDTRDEIIEALLPMVPFEGWSWKTVDLAAVECGHNKGVSRAVFPGRLDDVLDGFSDWADRKMMDEISAINPEDLRIRDRIRTALLTRYRALDEHREAVRLSAQYFMRPTKKPLGAKLVWRTADRIWDWAGDISTDYNRYTKRGLLSGILVSTTLVWVDDDSETLDNTKAFLDRRIENVMQFGKMINKIKKAS